MEVLYYAVILSIQSKMTILVKNFNKRGDYYSYCTTILFIRLLLCMYSSSEGRKDKGSILKEKQRFKLLNLSWYYKYNGKLC